MEIKYVVGEISLEEFEAFLNSKYFPAWEEAEAEYIEYMESLKKSVIYDKEIEKILQKVADDNQKKRKL